jgi:hypothetical protein
MIDYIEKIKSWLQEENKYIITQIQKPEVSFLLKVEGKQKNSFLPFHIFSMAEPNDKIMVYWGWSLLPEYIEGLKVTDDEVKRRFYDDLFACSFLTHVIMRFSPSIENLQSDLKLNLQEIQAQKVIRTDGLTKDRLIDAILQTMDAYGYVMLLFQKYNMYHPKFDPSSLM